MELHVFPVMPRKSNIHILVITAVFFHITFSMALVFLPISLILLYYPFQSIENAPELEELLPPKSVSSFKYNSEEDHGYTLSKEFREMVRGRKTAREITSWVEENIIQIHGSKFAIEVVIQTLLDIGSKSFTHLITVLERYGQVIAKLCTDQNMQVLLIDEVSSYWKNNTQMTAIAIDRMMGYRIISNLAIVSWVFSLSNIEQFHVSDRPWEVSPIFIIFYIA